MKNKLILFIFIILLICVYKFIDINTKENKIFGIKDDNLIEEKVDVDNYKLVLFNDEGIADNIYIVKIENKTEKEVSIINKLYQLGVDKLIDKKKSKYYYNYNNPLLILNPYGTNITGLYIYFKTIDNYKVEYTVSVPNSDIPNYSNTFSKGYTNEHEDQIIGLIQGVFNVVTIRLINSNNKVKYTYEFGIDVPNFNTNSIKKIDSEIIKEEELDNDLYVFLGIDDLQEADYQPITFYDKYGVLRAEFNKFSGKHTTNIIFIDDLMLYCYDSNNMVLVNKIGKIVKTIQLNNKTDHDYIYDEKTRQIIYLVGRTTVRSVNIDTKEDKLVFDTSDILSQYYKQMINKYGEDVDWSHINSLSIVNENDLIVSLRSSSSIIYIENFLQNPQIKYILAPPSIYTGTIYEQYLYKQVGDFPIHAGQHSVGVIEDDVLPDGKYYMYLFNNNYAKQNLSLDSSYYEKIEGVGNDNIKALKSMYYKYLIDENNNIFSLIDEIDVPYQSSKSNVDFTYDNHIIMGLSKTKELYEYNENNELILKMYMDVYDDFYRAYKVSMKGFWFL